MPPWDQKSSGAEPSNNHPEDPEITVCLFCGTEDEATYSYGVTVSETCLFQCSCSFFLLKLPYL